MPSYEFMGPDSIPGRSSWHIAHPAIHPLKLVDKWVAGESWERWTAVTDIHTCPVVWHNGCKLTHHRLKWQLREKVSKPHAAIAYRASFTLFTSSNAVLLPQHKRFEFFIYWQRVCVEVVALGRRLIKQHRCKTGSGKSVAILTLSKALAWGGGPYRNIS